MLDLLKCRSASIATSAARSRLSLLIELVQDIGANNNISRGYLYFDIMVSLIHQVFLFTYFVWLVFVSFLDQPDDFFDIVDNFIS